MTPQAASGSDLFERWNQDSWKQVLLFVTALWHDQDVSHLLKPITPEDPPYGLIFCGSALAEGATLDLSFEGYLVRRLCESASHNATGTICVRLMAGITDDSVEKADGVLEVLRLLSNRPTTREHFARLVDFMIQEARSWRKDMGNAAVNDLGILGRRAELLALAQDRDVYIGVRLSASRQLVKIGAVDLAVPVMISMFLENPSDRTAENILDQLGECKAVESLHLLYMQITCHTQRHAVQVLGAMDVLQEVSTDASLPQAVRESAILTLSNAGDRSSRQSIQQLFVERQTDQDSLIELVELLGRAKNWAALFDTVASPIAPLAVRDRAVNILEREKNQDELLTLLAVSEILPALQLKICKAIINLGDLRPIIEQLESFFEGFFGTNHDRDTLKQAHRLRAELHDKLADHEGAILEYGKVLEDDPNDEWVLGLRGNCYRLLGSYAQALLDFNARARP